MGGAVRAVGNALNQVGNVLNQVSNVLQQGVQLFQGFQNALNSFSQGIQGNQQDNRRADNAAQRAVNEQDLDRARNERARRRG